MLQVTGLDLFYGASQALRSVDLTAEKGAVTCVMGRNGVGKTSLLRAIAGQQGVAGGTMVWEESDVTKLAPYDRAARGIAYVPQGREIFPLLTVEENLETGYAAVPRALRHVPDDIYQLFPVLRDMLGRRGGDLSGGQQQQLAIARALVTRPRLLLLDEPTEGIQPSIIKDIERIIRFLADQGEMAIVLVEQYFEFARDLADAFVVMDRGEVVLSGKKDDMVEADVRRYLTV
ncbi:MAG: urea ABC transporter ATP-binding subunit UrtE [Proteobacteria bacterium]|jgi:urea transport system ATP-binding protein|nr:urea ABC transporter ATP-binding subunit UrtE [Pseudomonadota bacterium]